MSTKKHSRAAVAVFFSALLLLGCSTALVTENTVDVSSTTDDLTTRQIVYNLVKTKQNPVALPSQVQITSGNVSANTSFTPNVSVPLFPMLATTIAKANTSATISDTSTLTRPASGATINAGASNQDTWNTSFLQDPQQLRRLRYLYQYGAHQLFASRLLCEYPIPQQAQSFQPPANGKGRRYVRILQIGARTTSCRPNIAALVGDNPDPAFMTFPDCILCATPTTQFDTFFKKAVESKGLKIWKDLDLPEEEDINDQYEYVPVTLNPALAPTTVLAAAYRDKSQPYWSKSAPVDDSQFIDWMTIAKDGVDPVPPDSRPIGSTGGYTVYVQPESAQPFPLVTGDAHFSEFVLAIMEALLQPVQVAKAGAAPPPIVQAPPR